MVYSGATHSIVSTLQGVVLDPSGSGYGGWYQPGEGRRVFNFQFEVIHVPQFTHNLCSVAAMAREGYLLLKFKNGAGQFIIQRAVNLYFTTSLTSLEWSRCN